MHCTWPAAVALSFVIQICTFTVKQLLAFLCMVGLWIYLIFLCHLPLWLHLSCFHSCASLVLSCQATRLWRSYDSFVFVVYFLCLSSFSCFYNQIPWSISEERVYLSHNFIPAGISRHPEPEVASQVISTVKAERSELPKLCTPPFVQTRILYLGNGEWCYSEWVNLLTLIQSRYFPHRPAWQLSP